MDRRRWVAAIVMAVALAGCGDNSEVTSESVPAGPTETPASVAVAATPVPTATSTAALPEATSVAVAASPVPTSTSPPEPPEPASAVVAPSPLPSSTSTPEVPEPTSAVVAPSPAPKSISTPEPPGPTTPPVVVGSAGGLAVTEVVFEDHVTVTNLGSQAVDVGGLWMCNRPFYVPLPSVTLAPGESLNIGVGGLGGMPMMRGEAALYASDDFEDAGEMLDYVTWGLGGGRTRAAVQAGLWTEGDAVEPSGSSIVAPGGGSSSANWASR